MNIKQNEAFVNFFLQVQADVHGTSNNAGWWEDRRRLIAVADDAGLGGFASKCIGALNIALVHSEVSEGLEGERKDLKSDHIDGFSMLEEEFADVIIRIMDYAQENELRVAEAILAKAAFNKTRSHKHGGKNF